MNINIVKQQPRTQSPSPHTASHLGVVKLNTRNPAKMIRGTAQQLQNVESPLVIAGRYFSPQYTPHEVKLPSLQNQQNYISNQMSLLPNTSQGQPATLLQDHSLGVILENQRSSLHGANLAGQSSAANPPVQLKMQRDQFNQAQMQKINRQLSELQPNMGGVSITSTPQQQTNLINSEFFKKKNPDALKSKNDYLREEAERFNQVYNSLPLKQPLMPGNNFQLMTSESSQMITPNQTMGLQSQPEPFGEVCKKLYDSLTVQVIEDSINVTLYNPNRSVLGPIQPMHEQQTSQTQPSPTKQNSPSYTPNSQTPLNSKRAQLGNFGANKESPKMAKHQSTDDQRPLLIDSINLNARHPKRIDQPIALATKGTFDDEIKDPPKEQSKETEIKEAPKDSQQSKVVNSVVKHKAPFLVGKSPQRNHSALPSQNSPYLPKSEQRKLRLQLRNESSAAADRVIENSQSHVVMPEEKIEVQDEQQPSQNNQNAQTSHLPQQTSQPQQVQASQRLNWSHKHNSVKNEYILAEEQRQAAIQRFNDAKEQGRIYMQMHRNVTKYKYFIAQGNNSAVIRKCMELRDDRWEETNGFDKLYNFRWQPWGRGLQYNAVNSFGVRQMVNHVQGHEYLTTKHLLFESMAQHCENKKLDVFKFLPLTFTLQLQLDSCQDELLKFLTFFGSLASDQPLAQINNKLAGVQLPANLKYSDRKWVQTSKYQVPASHFKGQNVWILKATGFNRGVGIHVFNKVEQLLKILQEYCESLESSSHTKEHDLQQLQLYMQHCQKHINKDCTDNTPETTKKEQPANDKEEETENKQSVRSTSFVIQKYMEAPLLVAERKFDIRVWVLVTNSAQVFVFKQGYIRTTSSVYTLDQESILKPEIHLTNNAIQSQFKDYGKFEDGNILSFDEFQKYLDDNDGMPNFVESKLIPDMYKQIQVSIEAAKSQLYLGKGFFEIYGYDFLVDADYDSWLIEVNTNPSFEESSPLLQQLIPRMINDALKLTIDQSFQAKKGQNAYDQSKINAFAVDGEEDDQNLWLPLTNFFNDKAEKGRGNRKVFVP